MNYLKIGIGIAIFLIVVWLISKFNKLKKQEIKVKEAESGIDVALTKRYDMLVKLFDIAKGYLEKEEEIIIESIKLRNGMAMEEKLEVNKKMDEAVNQLNIVAEAYPKLSSIENFKELQHGIMDAEEHLQAARRLYNSNVSVLNQSVSTIPTNIVAGLFGIKNKPMFEAEEFKKNDVNFKF